MTPQERAEELRAHVESLNSTIDKAFKEGLRFWIELDLGLIGGLQMDPPSISISDTLEALRLKETTMYIPQRGSKPEKKFWIVWRVRNNETHSWLAKQDCPTVVHGTYQQAIHEADRLAESTKEQFVVFEAVATTNPKQQTKEFKSDVKLLCAH